MLRDRHVLIAFSQQPSVADFMARFLEEAGYAAVACWSTLDDLESAVSAQSPAAVVYEVGFPLAEEWKRFGEARRRPTLAHVPLVIATPATPDQYRRFGISDALEVFTRPSRRAVEAALRGAVDLRPRIPDAA
ncbi:MAG TPA: hypothetical protein VJS39_03460 [Gemmatimonadaceae bacterium]|nr:hypothetical protein [Gemmatimonadaceae bacterium]